MARRKQKVRTTTRGIGVVSPAGANVDPTLAATVSTISQGPTGTHVGVPPLSYSILKSMAYTPIVAALVSTRQNQTADYAKRLTSPHMNGWTIRLRAPNAIPSRADRYRMDHIAAIIQTAGGDWQPGGFEQFIRSMTYYTLVFDQAHIQPIKTELGKPCAYRLLDPMTVRRFIPLDDLPQDGNIDYSKSELVQVINGKEVARFKHGDVSWSVRNALPGVTTFGYGMPELAMLVGIVTAMLNAHTHNAQLYTTGFHGMNMVTFKSLMGPERWKRVEESIQAMLAGVRRNKGVPIFQLNPNLNESVEVHPFGKPPSDMEFMNWLNYNAKIICAMYGMDPIELGFVFGDEKPAGKSKSDLSPEDRIVASKERSLRPLLRWIALQINETLIWPYWPDYQFEFYGFDSVSETQKQENLIKAVQNFMSVNEARASLNLPPWKDPISNRPLNASYQMYLQKLVEQGVSLNPDIIPDDVAAFVGGRRMPAATPRV